MAPNPETPKQIIQWLERLGFTATLEVDGASVADAISGKTYDPAGLTVSAAFCCAVGEGPDGGDAAGDATVYAVATEDGQPVGTLLLPPDSACSPDEATVAEVLRSRAALQQGTGEHRDHRHIAAVFPDREHAEAAVQELISQGLGSEHLGVAVHGDTHVAFERDEEAVMGSDAVAGTAAGAGLGALAGMALTALVVPGLAPLGVAGLFAVGAASGFGGAMLGGFLGIAAADEAFSAHGEIRETPLEPGEVLVAVLDHGKGDTVEAVLRDNGGTLLTLGPSIP
ncbi:MAG: hypothetical protein KDB31_07040 [Microthrixaceae bacterium]|nr:hypothetical protein [Microthrixaceae bacterium]